jgi:hypothetical protein
VSFQVDARFCNLHAFGFEELFLQGSVGLADKDFAAFADYAVPGNAFTGWRGGHGTAHAARAAREAQKSRKRPIG